jgi:hypothetical protein
MDTDRPAMARRNRMIAIAAGVITVIVIVLGFASGYLGQQWNWLRPAGELLLLAELVGLVVLERHQLFEPVSEAVGAIKIDTTELRSTLAALDPLQIRDTLASLADSVTNSGQLRMYVSPPEVAKAMTRAFREALAREQTTPQNPSLIGPFRSCLFCRMDGSDS